MRWQTIVGVSAMCAIGARADGLIPAELKDVVPSAEAIVVVQIISNDVTTVERKAGESGGPASVRTTCRIRFKAVESLQGNVPDETDLLYEFVVVQGVWVTSSGSGREVRMKPGEKYLFLLTSQDGQRRLLRAEPVTQLDTIRDLLRGPATTNAVAAVPSDPVVSLNEQIETFNATRNVTRLPDMGITPIRRRVARVTYDAAQDRVTAHDGEGQSLLVLDRQPDGRFMGTLRQPYHQLAGSGPGGSHSWGDVMAPFYLGKESFVRERPR